MTCRGCCNEEFAVSYPPPEGGYTVIVPSLARACVTFGGSLKRRQRWHERPPGSMLRGSWRRARRVRLRYDPAEVAAACAGQEDLRILPAARNFDR